MSELKDASTHFAFGENWASYAALIDRPQIEASKKSLLRMVPEPELKNASFLDIGCGSGLHALAAAELGVSRILAVDLDPNSVAACQTVLAGRNLSTPWKAEVVSVFDLKGERQGYFDIVYSWGVLHHTGAMWEAIDKAASMVKPGGLFAVALYGRTYLDWFWGMEKRMYAHAPRLVQKIMFGLFVAAYRTALLAKGVRYSDYCKNYKSDRGMDHSHDIHDWLGGYPYETALSDEVESRLVGLGFKAERVFARGKRFGLFGSACDEYVYRRVA